MTFDLAAEIARVNAAFGYAPVNQIRSVGKVENPERDLLDARTAYIPLPEKDK